MEREICWERDTEKRERKRNMLRKIQKREEEKYAERGKEWKWSQIEGGLGIHFKVNFLPILDLIQLYFKFSQKSSLEKFLPLFEISFFPSLKMIPCWYYPFLVH